MDRAGWHIASDLVVPANLTPLVLPPYAPELDAIERVWLYLREHFLSHRQWPSYDDILDACCSALNALLNETRRIRSLCALDWATLSPTAARARPRLRVPARLPSRMTHTLRACLASLLSTTTTTTAPAEAQGIRGSPRPRRLRPPAARPPAGEPRTALHSLLSDLATLARNTVRFGRAYSTRLLATPTPLQERTLDLLGLKPAP